MTVSGLVRPAYLWTPPSSGSYGPVVVKLLRDEVGFDPDPEQEMALEIIFGIRPGGRTAAFEAAVICSRQNLKTALFEMCTVGWLFITEQNLVVWSAHEFSTAQEAHRDLSLLIEGNSWLKKRLKRIISANGKEAIELKSGQRVKFKARTKSGGRGLTGDKVVLDEAFALQAAHMGALLPTLSAVPDPQVVYGSSAGHVDSAILRGVRDRGRPGGDPSLAYLEWCDDLPGSCADPNCVHELNAVGCALDDRDRWARSNPALGRRISVEYVAAERRALASAPEEFARERLGWWDDPDTAGRVIDLASWAALEDPGSQLVGDMVFGFDVTPTRDFGAICVAGRRADGLLHAEVVDVRPGTGWMVERLSQLVADHGCVCPIVLEEASPAGSLVVDLEAKGVQVEPMSSREVAQACGQFFDLVTDSKGLRHVKEPAIEEALAGAAKRDLGDAWAWTRNKSTANISPLVALTLAVRWFLVFGEGLGPDDVYVG